jgi:hypothetical protein
VVLNGRVSDVSLIKKSKERILFESELFNRVAEEIEQGEIHKGLWAKARANTGSANQDAIQGEYIRLRVEHLEAEYEVGADSVNLAAKQIEREANRRTNADARKKAGETFLGVLFIVLAVWALLYAMLFL